MTSGYCVPCTLTLDEGLDLELIYEEQNAQFYINKGIKSGITQRFVRDIKRWAKQYKLNKSGFLKIKFIQFAFTVLQ
jgi:hypothetical protein